MSRSVLALLTIALPLVTADASHGAKPIRSCPAGLKQRKSLTGNADGVFGWDWGACWLDFTGPPIQTNGRALRLSPAWTGP